MHNRRYCDTCGGWTWGCGHRADQPKDLPKPTEEAIDAAAEASDYEFWGEDIDGMEQVRPGLYIQRESTSIFRK